MAYIAGILFGWLVMRVFLIMALLSCGAPLAALALHPDAGSPIRLVIVAPWQDAHALIASAGGTVLGPERAPFALLAQTSDPDQFNAAARSLGAWWVTDGAAVAELCGVTP
ncbi:MAG: hypothetical protein AAGF36_12315 [Pseudomonadota bacterium]